MAKPAVTLYTVKGSPLTTSELDTNFTNLRDSTINFTGDAGDTRSMDLNDATAITGSKNIRVTVSESGQSIVVKNTLSDYTLDPMGFENWTDSVISFDNGTRVFTISPTSGTYRYWYQGTQYDITTTKTVTITNTSDLYLVYFNGATLSVTTDHINWSTMVPVAHVYWNATAGAAIITDERHGVWMDRGTKEYLHAVVGAGYASGLLISNYTTTGTGANNADAQLDISSGVIYDQEHRIDIVHSNSPTANTFEQDLQGPARIPVVYRSNSHWIRDAARDYAVKNGTSLVTYNLNTAGVWSTPDAVTTHYVAYWIVATNVIGSPVLSIMGQREDNKLSDAVTNNTWSSLDLTDFPAEELRPLYRVIFRTAAGYANTPKAYIAQVDDFRFSEIIPSGGLSTTSSFSNIAVSGQSTVQADAADDTLTLVAGTGIQITTNATTDEITIVATGAVSGALLNVVEDTTPQLGGNLDVNGQSIVSVSNGNIVIAPNGTGKIQLDGVFWPASDGTNTQVLSTNGAGTLAWVDPTVTLTNTLTGNLNTQNYYLFSSIGNVEINDDLAFINTSTATGPTGNSTTGLLIRNDSTNDTSIKLTSTEIEIKGPIQAPTGTKTLELLTTSLKLGEFTTTARNSLTAQNGMLIYNTSTNKAQVYANGTWVDLH